MRTCSPVLHAPRLPRRRASFLVCHGDAAWHWRSRHASRVASASFLVVSTRRQWIERGTPRPSHPPTTSTRSMHLHRLASAPQVHLLPLHPYRVACLCILQSNLTHPVTDPSIEMESSVIWPIYFGVISVPCQVYAASARAHHAMPKDIACFSLSPLGRGSQLQSVRHPLRTCAQRKTNADLRRYDQPEVCGSSAFRTWSRTFDTKTWSPCSLSECKVDV